MLTLISLKEVNNLTLPEPLYLQWEKFRNIDRGYYDWASVYAPKGYAPAQYLLGQYFRSISDYAKAAEWSTKAAVQDFPKALNLLGLLYSNGQGVEENQIKAFDLFLRAAQMGEIYAMYNVGYGYYKGLGVEQDYKTAFSWFSKAADKGHRKAYLMIGIFYHDGYGVEKNVTKAVEAFSKCAEMGNSSAQFILGRWYLNGEMVQKDEQKGILLLRKAANSESEAAYILGKYYYENKDTNYEEAFKWFTDASEKGEKAAMRMLGECYFYGRGTCKDECTAKDWYVKAGDEETYNRLKAEEEVAKEKAKAEEDAKRKAEVLHIKAKAHKDIILALKTFAFVDDCDKFWIMTKKIDSNLLRSFHMESSSDDAFCKLFSEFVGVEFSLPTQAQLNSAMRKLDTRMEDCSGLRLACTTQHYKQIQSILHEEKVKEAAREEREKQRLIKIQNEELKRILEERRQKEAEEKRRLEEKARRREEELKRHEAAIAKAAIRKKQREEEDFKTFCAEFLSKRAEAKSVGILWKKSERFKILTTPLTRNVFETFNNKIVCTAVEGEALLDINKDRKEIVALTGLLGDSIYKDEGVTFTLPSIRELVGAQSAKVIGKDGVYLVCHFPDFEE